MMNFLGVKIPSFGQLHQFIEHWSLEEKFQACEYAWEMYMTLADLATQDRSMKDTQSQVAFDVLHREACVAMGAMWAYREMFNSAGKSQPTPLD